MCLCEVVHLKAVGNTVQATSCTHNVNGSFMAQHIVIQKRFSLAD